MKKTTYQEALTFFTKQIVRARVTAEKDHWESVGIIDDDTEFKKQLVDIIYSEPSGFM